MRTQLSVVAILGYALAVAAQTSPPGTQAPATPLKDAASTITLTGCVGQTGQKGDQFTLSDPSQGGAESTTYRLTGTNVRRHVGRRVKVVGGLVPSPNVAAQMGALSATQSSMIGAGGSASGTVTGTLPEFRVKVLTSLPEPCPQR